jgi:putative membrane protein insertion efficiency factor
MSSVPLTRQPSVLARPLLAVIRGYQLVRAGRPSPCRFDPSCSTYAMDALRVHGAVRGSLLALRRLARCHPWGGWGYDPVPDKKATR